MPSAPPSPVEKEMARVIAIGGGEIELLLKKDEAGVRRNSGY
jgi:hypothetical protein